MRKKLSKTLILKIKLFFCLVTDKQRQSQPDFAKYMILSHRHTATHTRIFVVQHTYALKDAYKTYKHTTKRRRTKKKTTITNKTPS